jgi:pSer/pThr/pTyr-binding forkhead associated (FHA) protein
MWTLKAATTVLAENGDPEKPLIFRLPEGAVKTVGRTGQSDFVLDAALVSRVHCRLMATMMGELHVEDLASTNGTFVNDQRVERAVLATGDRLRIGRVELAVTKER